MKKTWLIARHEFIVTIRRISYILFTISFPVLTFLGILVYTGVTYLVISPPPEEQKIGYVDYTGLFDDFTDSQEGVLFVPYPTEGRAMDALFRGNVTEYFVVPEDYMDTGQITRYTTARELELPETTIARVEDFLVANILSGEVSEELVERAQKPLIPVSIRLNPKTGLIAPPMNPLTAFALPYGFGLLFMISLFVTSGFLLQGVSEEKENRLIEILLSSVSARQLMTGKVLGLGAAGLLQIAIWLLTAVILSAFAPIAGLSIPVGIILPCIVFFILGYLLFGTIWTLIGSIGSTARESSQWTIIVVMPAIVPIMLIGLFGSNPEHVVFTILTLFPLTAPITAVMRLSAGTLPTWELLLSIVILIASILGAIWLAARVLRTFLLMYGKRPSLGEIWRCIREG
jgi:ABC-2 type transport system permease protein